MHTSHYNLERALSKLVTPAGATERVGRPSEIIEPSEDGNVNILSLLQRYLPLTVLTIAIGLLASLAQVVLSTPVYRAQLLLEIQPVSKDLGGSMDPFSALHDFDAINLQTELTILHDGPVRKRVLARMLEMPRMTSRTQSGLFPKLRMRLRPKSVAKEASQRESLLAAASSFDAKIVNQTRLVVLSCESPNPAITSGFLNAFAEEFVQESIQEREEASLKTTAWLTSHLGDTKAKLQDAEARLRAFVLRSGNEFASSEKTVDEVKLKQLQSELAAAQAVAIAKQAAYETALRSPREAIAELATDSIATTIRAQLADLEKQKAVLLITLMPLNPKVVAIQEQEKHLEQALQKEETTLLARLQSEYEGARDHEHLLYSAYQNESDQVSSQSSKATEFAALSREVDGFQKIYDSLTQELNKTQVAQSAPVNPVRLVEPSTPPTVPYTPKPKTALTLGIVGGLAVAVAIAFVKEKFDRRLRSPESLRALFRLPQLGVIPSAPSDWRTKTRSALKLSRKMVSPFALLAQQDLDRNEHRDFAHSTWSDGAISLLAESFRATLASIQRQLADEHSAKVIMVTSATPGEGKTTVVSNLGIALSEAGRRVVVVDLDFRRPALSKIFGINSSVSLPHILEDSRSIDEYPTSNLVSQTTFSGLFVLPSTASNARIPTLIYSKRLTTLLSRLRREFDIVLADVPPILFPADARVVAQLADAAILIIRSGYAEKDNIQAAVHVLCEDRIPILGTVLNDCAPSRIRSGSDYYNYYAKQKPQLS